MSAAIDELKTRARVQLNQARRSASAGDLRLRDCLQRAARDVGFQNWEHARRVLGGLAVHGDDMGTFWHATRCSGLLNQWFANLAEARAAHGGQGHSYLLPYRRQFVLVHQDFIRELGLEPGDEEWSLCRRDLVSAYGGAAWQALCARRVKSPRSTFG